MPAPHVDRLREIIRYYQVGLLNAAFGFGGYALLVRLGVDPFLAQLIAHVAGVAFNYVTYSRHVFRGAPAAKLRFVGSYAVNYVVSLGFLALARHLVASPYVAGAIAIVATSVVNYVALKYIVFARPSRA